jgi:hypothetical protein
MRRLENGVNDARSTLLRADPAELPTVELAVTFCRESRP